MSRLTACWLATLLVGLAPLTAQGQGVEIFGLDFENAFPVPGPAPGIAFTFGGVSGGADPFNPTFPQEITAAADGNSQAYQISFDTSGVQNQPGEEFSFFFGGFGIFAEFFGTGSRTADEFMSEGPVLGAGNPSNWSISLDVRSTGAIDPSRVLTGNFTYFDDDFDSTMGFDGDGNPASNGADTYILPLEFADDNTTDTAFTTNVINLGDGLASTEVENDQLRFADDGTFVLNFGFNNGLYPNAAGNSIAIDNFSLVFTPPPVVPGDYNADGVVNTADYAIFRDNLGTTFQLDNEGDGITPGEVTIEDFDFWLSQFGNTGAALGLSAAVPEPASACLLAIACMLTGRRRLNR